MRRLTLFVLLVASLGARAQDVLSIGTGTTQVPVSIAKNTGNAVNGVAFRVLFDGEVIASMSFARSGALTSVTPLYERAQQGSGWFSYIALFSAATNLSGQIGTLTASPQPQAVPGTTVALLLDPPGAMLSNQAASVVETVANGSLALSNGSITIDGAIAAPSTVTATASGTALVNVTWSAVAGAEYYEVWRSVDGSAFAPVASPTAPPYADSEVVAGKAYLYRIRAVTGGGAQSPLSNPDVATTIVFTSDPLNAGATIRLAHITQLRFAVNALRASASLAPLAADPTIAAGAVVRAAHITALRTGLNQARDAAGLPAIAFDATLTIIRSAHVTTLRNGVK
jgi:hypothetical protein